MIRLLNVNSFTFQTFRSPDIPPYIIASHRWNEGTEASIGDIEADPHDTKAGCQKVKGFAEYVRSTSTSIQWLWIDTCCIDQESYREVPEAINSMFRWYSEAEACIAYLQDVQDPKDDVKFRESVWFKRGWTLQELLAPQTVIFLTGAWQVIGHKGISGRSRSGDILHTGPSLEESIASITSVPIGVLHDPSIIHSVSVEARLGWMDGRETTREEDSTYCLFGLFNVTMLANYGEGGDKARRRLHAEMSAADLSLVSSLPDVSAVLKSVSIAEGASYDSFIERGSSQCLEGTRAELLADILHWVDAADSATFFWLCGKAGTGKSTVSRTAARMFHKELRCLAANFFFKRGEQNRASARYFFPTLAVQLASKFPIIASSIAKSCQGGACSKNLDDQFDELIFQPLQQMSNMRTPARSLAIVIDALDECDSTTDVRTIVKLLSTLRALSSLRTRVFVTSRPESSIQLCFRQLQPDAYQTVSLEDHQLSTIARDIRAYVLHSINEIKVEDSHMQPFDPLPDDWPGDWKIQALVERAVPLFIFASTVIRFIAEFDPQARLDAILAESHYSDVMGLESVYLQVLTQSISDDLDEQRRQIAICRFQTVVGGIITLAHSLSAQSLSRLLQISLRDMGLVLNRLHSVLSVPASRESPVRLFHLSFKDFLTEQTRRSAGEFWIDQASSHARLAESCLQRLCQPGTLRRNYFGINDPGYYRTGREQQELGVLIPEDVAYACCYWPWHLTQSIHSLQDDNLVLRFLLNHFLHWLELLSWLDSVHQGFANLNSLTSLLKPGQNTYLKAFLIDAKQFGRNFVNVISLTPLQTYYTALVFAPNRSEIKILFSSDLPHELALLPVVPDEWGTETMIMGGFPLELRLIRFSPDGKTMLSVAGRVAGGAAGAVHLWDISTGRLIRTFETDCPDAYAATLIEQGRKVVLSLHTGSLYTLDLRTGDNEVNHVFRSESASQDVLSPDGTRVATTLIRVNSLRGIDTTSEVTLYDTGTGHVYRRYQVESFGAGVRILGFSPDSNHLAVTPRNNKILIFASSREESLAELQASGPLVTSFAFSTDGCRAISGSSGGWIQIWSLSESFEVSRVIYDGSSIGIVQLSPDGRTAMAVTEDAIRVWDVETKRRLQSLSAHGLRMSETTFSPDGQTLASLAYDGTVRLWDITLPDSDSLGIEIDAGYKRLLSVSTRQDSMVSVLCQGANIGSMANSPLDPYEALGYTNAMVIVVEESYHAQPQPGSTLMSDKLSICRSMRKRMTTFRGKPGWFFQLRFSPHGQLLASSSYKSNKVRVWDVVTGWKRINFNEEIFSTTAPLFSANGSRMIVNKDDLYTVWNVSSGEKVYQTQYPPYLTKSVSFSMDENILVVENYVRSIDLYDIRRAGTLREIEVEMAESFQFALSLGQRLLATLYGTIRLQVRDLQMDTTIANCRLPYKTKHLRFSKNDRFLLTDNGVIDLEADENRSTTASVTSKAIWKFIYYGDGWIRYYDCPLIWLPHEYRGDVYVVDEDTLALVRDDGSSTVFRFKDRSGLRDGEETQVVTISGSQ